MAATSASPEPRTTSEPENTCGRSSPPGRWGPDPGRSSDATLRTGTDSPVSGRFVGLQVLTLQEDGVGRNPVALGKDDEVAPHDVPASDPLALAIANDKRTGAGEVAQRLQNALGAGLLHHGDHDRHGGEGDQDDRLLQIAEQEVNDAADQEQRQHRFAQHLNRYPKRRAPIGLGKLIMPLGLQPRLGIDFTEATERSLGFREVRHYTSQSGSIDVRVMEDVSALIGYGLTSTVATERRLYRSRRCASGHQS